MFRLSIVTPERVVYDDNVRSMTVPGIDGYLGILAHHAPIITALKPGKIEYFDESGQLFILSVSNGFVEVSNNVATILADAVEVAEDIDIERARAAYEREMGHLHGEIGDEEIDTALVRAALERARNRIRIYEETH